MKENLVGISKFLSLILRHQPETIGLTLDANGWADLDELIAKARAHGRRLDEAVIREVVASNDKQRFALDDVGRRIRANQGHSVSIEIGLQPLAPPDVLFHGTATRFLEAIRREGLKPMNRQHVHLSLDLDTAVNVGSRHGKPLVLRVRAAELATAGQAFFRSENGVWLTTAIAPAFIEIVDPVPRGGG